MSTVDPTAAEVAARLPGDDLVPDANVVMDRAMTLPAPPAQVWPWLVQLGKRRAGWYMSRRVERFIPRSRRAVRTIEARWQGLAVGDVIPDWGGKTAEFVVAVIDTERCLVHRSTRGHSQLSWALVLKPVAGGQTRLQLRLRLGGVERVRLAGIVGGGFDEATIILLRAGLAERLQTPTGEDPPATNG